MSGKEVYTFTQSATMDNEHFENSMIFVKQSEKMQLYMMVCM